MLHALFLPLRSFIASALDANKIINTHRCGGKTKREASRRFGRVERGDVHFAPARWKTDAFFYFFFTFSSSFSSSSSFASCFPSFSHQVRLLHPLTMPWRALHTTRLFLQGVFSRECHESTHICAHVDTKFARVCDRAHAH